MNDEGSLFPPTQYDFIWPLLAVALVVMAIVFYVFLFVSTKKLKPEPIIQMLPRTASSMERLSLIKNKYTKKVIDIQSAHSEGTLSNRKAFQALSINLRNFTHEYSGTGAHAMSLTDLHRTQAPEVLLNKIKNYYPLAFEEANKNGNVELAVNDALRVIQLWH